MKMILAALVVLPLAGCGLTPQGDVLRSAISKKGADAADAGREGAIWYLCNGISAGALRRWIAGDGHRMAAWNILCDPAAGGLVFPGTEI